MTRPKLMRKIFEIFLNCKMFSRILLRNFLPTRTKIFSWWKTSLPQNTNWAIIQEQFDIYAVNLHILRDCDQLLFANQQPNFNFDTISSLLAMIHASAKSYRSALFAFLMSFLNSIPVLLQRHLPMSLIPMESL